MSSRECVHSLLLKRDELEAVASSQQLNGGILVRRHHYGVCVDPADEADRHKRGHDGEVNLRGRRESLVFAVPVAAPGQQGKLVATQRAV